MKINPLIVMREEFDGSGIIFNPDNGDTFGLNPTAVFLWKQLEQELQPDEILANLKGACSGDLPESAAADLQEFIDELTAKGYLSC